MITKSDLIFRMGLYIKNLNKDLVSKTYDFIIEAHGNQMRKSGEFFYVHPITVAEILLSYKLDENSIIAALLHDTVEDTSVTIEKIETLFGKDIALLVDGVTKLSKIEIESHFEKNNLNERAENFRKFILAISKDIRVLIIKLADRLHNMRTLHFIQDSLTRQKIAKETLELYSKLAARIGMNKIKEELDDSAFKHLNEQSYEAINNRLKYLCSILDGPIDKIKTTLQSIFIKAEIDCKILGRLKTPYSIWQKMISNDTTFEQIYDIMAFKIIVQTIPDCYKVLGILHCNYWVVPGTFKDYISTPKSNNYQSLHTSLIGPKHKRIEVQIKTYEMDDLAENGVASHWQYKQNINAFAGTQYRWVRNLLNILEQAETSEKFLENTKLEMFNDKVFCFTVNGEIVTLPTGVTPIDFAYTIDPKIGDRIVGAKINNKIRPLCTKLVNGDQVEIITSENENNQKTLNNFLITGKAKAYNEKLFSKCVKKGEKFLEQILSERGLKLSKEMKKFIANEMNYESEEDFLFDILNNRLMEKKIINILDEVSND